MGLSLIAAMGCSPAPDPIGKGRAIFSVGPSGPTCVLPDQGAIGDPPPDMPNPDYTVDNLGEPVVDGQSVGSGDGEYEVKCKVTKSGKLDLEIVGPNYESDPTSVGEARVEVRGNISTRSGEGRGDVTVRTVVTGAMASQGSSTCTLTALKDRDGDPAVGAGSAAFVFECASAASSLDDFGSCPTRGTVIVEDCIEK